MPEGAKYHSSDPSNWVARNGTSCGLPPLAVGASVDTVMRGAVSVTLGRVSTRLAARRPTSFEVRSARRLKLGRTLLNVLG